MELSRSKIVSDKALYRIEPNLAVANKRLVILGCGYVGSAVAARAIEAGMHVTTLTRNVEKADALRKRGAEVIVADLANDSWHDLIDGGADWVLDSVSSGGGGVSGYRQSYVDGAHSLRAWAKKKSLGIVVYTSSTSVYPQTGGVTVEETSSTEGVAELPAILLEAEAVFPSISCERWFVLRLAGIYGPNRHQLLDQIRSGVTELPGGGSHHLNLIYLDDICSAIWSAFCAGSKVDSAILNISDGHPATKAEVIAWLAERLNRPIPRFTGSTSARRRASDGSTPDRIVSNEKAKELLGWKPRFTDFRAGYESILTQQ